MAGYMPLQRQVGFIYDNPNLFIIAHELGHGAFNLRHTFSPENFIAAERTTQNLMDYAGGTELWAHQWGQIRDPQNIWFAWAQEEGEGEMEKNKYYIKIRNNNEKYDNIIKVHKSNNPIYLSLYDNVTDSLIHNVTWLIDSDTIARKIDTCSLMVNRVLKKNIYAIFDQQKVKYKLDVISEYNYFIGSDTVKHKMNEKIYCTVNKDSLMVEVKALNGDVFKARWEKNNAVIASNTNKCWIALDKVESFDVKLYFEDGDEQKLSFNIYAPPFISFENNNNYNGEFLFDDSFVDMPNMRNASFFDTLVDPYRNKIYYNPAMGLGIGQIVQLKVNVNNFPNQALSDPNFKVIIKCTEKDIVKINNSESLELTSNALKSLSSVSIEAIDAIVGSVKIIACLSSSNKIIGQIEYYCNTNKIKNATLIYVKFQGESAYPNFDYAGFESYLKSHSMNQLFLDVNIDTICFASSLTKDSLSGLSNLQIVQRLEGDRQAQSPGRGIDHTYYYITNLSLGNLGGFHAVGDGYGLKTASITSAFGETENEICAHEFGHWQGFYHPFDNATNGPSPYNINIVGIKGDTKRYFMDYDIRRKKWFKYEMLNVKR